METALNGIAPALDQQDEQRLYLADLSWADYLTLSSAFDDRPAIRISYLEGQVEIMVTSAKHELIKKMIARLVEAFALVRGLNLIGIGSTTFRNAAKERGLEPDECYCLDHVLEIPQLAIEVVVSRGVINKLAIYAGLGVSELWAYEDGAVRVLHLEDGRYVESTASRFLPGLDLDLLARFAERQDQGTAVREFVAAIGGFPRR